MEINRTTLKAVRTHLEKILNDNPINGINLELGNCSFDSAQADFKLKMTVEGGQTREEKHLQNIAKIHNINLELDHPTWQIVGYRQKARTKPFLAVKKSAPNQRYILSFEDIQRMGFISSVEGA